MKRLSRWLVFVFAGLVLFPSDGSTQAPYYAGKTITVIEGNSAGGVADLRTKSIVQFLQKYIPGNPTIVTQYVPGGGGRQAANQVYRAAADGLTIGASSPGVLSSAVLGETGVEYDPYKFIYLGSPFSENINMFATRKALGINSLEKLRAASGIRIGAQSVGHVQYIRGRLFAWLLDVKEPRFVVGYSGNRVGDSFGAWGNRRASDNAGHADADGVLPKSRRFPCHSGESQRTSSASICPFA